MKLTLLVLCIFLLACLISSAKRKLKKAASKSNDKAVPFIGGGPFPTNIHHAAFVVGLLRLYREYHEYFCAGVIIAKRWALTAGTCVEEVTYEDIMLGVVVLRGGTKWIGGTGGFDHRIDRIANINCNQSTISAIQVKDAFINDPFEKPITVIAGREQLQDFSEYDAEVFGWGKSAFQGNTEVLKSATVKVVNNNFCKKYYEDMYLRGWEFACARTITGYFCDRGGGPFVRDNLLLGIALNNKCDPDVPGLYMRIQNFAFLIKKLVNTTELTFDAVGEPSSSDCVL